MTLVPFPGSQTPAGPRSDRSARPDDGLARSSVGFPGGDPPDPDEDDHGKMSFLEHLDELRKRLIYAVISLGVGVALSFAFIDRVFTFIFRPMQRLLPPGSTLIYTEPTEAFTLYLQIALLTGLVLSAPAIMWQVWLFIAPGLYSHEKRFAIPFVLLSTIGFLGGAAFSHYVLFPFTWSYLASFSNDYVMFTPKLDPVFSLYVKMMLGMGLVFQMPTIVFFLAKMGVLTARFMVRNIKFAILIIFVVSAVITPSGDMLNQTVFAAPMIGLYLISIVIAWVFGKRSRAAEDS